MWVLPVQPFEIQKRATEVALNQPGWGHFLEQGLGKTAVTYNEWGIYKSLVDCLVVVAPNSLLRNWESEANKLGITDEVVVWSSSRAKSCTKTITDLAGSADRFVLVINYEAITTSGEKILEWLLTKRKVMLVADESINLKNPTSQRSKKLREFSKSAVIRRVLSGAPITQGVHDLWAQLKFIGACDGLNFFSFRNRYCVMGGFRGKKVIRQRSDTAEELNSILASCSLRAEKKDWTDIPDKLYTDRFLEMTGAQLGAYKEMLDEFTTTVKDSSISADLVITKLMKLQQISSGFVIDNDGKAHYVVPDSGNPKLNMLLDVIEETSGKLLVFVYHREATELLRRNLNPEETVFLVGGLSPEEIEIEKTKFNSDDGIKVAVCQINATMYGHTLLGTKAKPCHTTVFFENVYSLNARVQAEDRNHRHGQTNNVLYVDLVVSELDQKIIETLKSKRNVADTVMDYLRVTK